MQILYFSVSTLDSGSIKSKIYRLSDSDDLEFISFITQISESLIIDSTLTTTPANQLFEYLDQMNYIKFIILDQSFDDYVVENYPQITLTQIN